jgi:hypothetical protein
MPAKRTSATKSIVARRIGWLSAGEEEVTALDDDDDDNDSCSASFVSS